MLSVCVTTTWFQIIRTYALSVHNHNRWDVMPRLIAAETIKWSNFTALVLGLDVFWAYQWAIFCLLFTVQKHIIPPNY